MRAPLTSISITPRTLLDGVAIFKGLVSADEVRSVSTAPPPPLSTPIWIGTKLGALPPTALLVARPSAPPVFPGDHLNTAIGATFLPGINHGIGHRCTSNDQLMPGGIAAKLHYGEAGAYAGYARQTMRPFRCRR